MPGPYVDSTTLTQAVADILKQSNTSLLEPYYARIIPPAITQAYQDILSALLGRGYTVAQIDTWANAAVINQQQALFWVLTQTGGLGHYDDQQIAKLDHRKNLKELALTDSGGNLILPGAGASGLPGPVGIPGDTFGGAAIGGGRLDQGYWRTSLRTRF